MKKVNPRDPPLMGSNRSISNPFITILGIMILRAQNQLLSRAIVDGGTPAVREPVVV